MKLQRASNVHGEKKDLSKFLLSPFLVCASFFLATPSFASQSQVEKKKSDRFGRWFEDKYYFCSKDSDCTVIPRPCNSHEAVNADLANEAAALYREWDSRASIRCENQIKTVKPPSSRCRDSQCVLKARLFALPLFSVVNLVRSTVY